jgi:acyl-CoA synthetase (NDP forming)
VELVPAEILDKVPSICPDARLEGVLLVEQVPDGLDVVIGMVIDATLGAVIMFNLGGVFVKAVRDLVFQALRNNRDDAIAAVLTDT